MIRRIRALVRATCLLCPLCGKPWPRVGWVGLARRCPNCQIQLERHESDYFLGAYTLNLFATLGVATLVTVGIAWWEAVPLAARWVAGLAAIVVFAVWFYRRSKLFWLVVDLQFRPPEEPDFEQWRDPGA